MLQQEWKKQMSKLAWASLVFGALSLCLGLITLLAIVPYFLLSAVAGFENQGPAMRPSLDDGDRILVYKWAYSRRAPRRWDVVVFTPPEDEGKRYVKRIVGLPGERLAIRNDTLCVNGEPIDLPEELGGARYYGIDNEYGPGAEESYFVIGDNSRVSKDSRALGWVPRENVTEKRSARGGPRTECVFTENVVQDSEANVEIAI